MQDIIRLNEIDINLGSPPHQDIPHDSKILAQIIVEHMIFAQTLSVDSLDDKKDSWKLRVDCNIPSNKPNFSIAILRENPTNVRRLLGKVDFASDEILAEARGKQRQVVEYSVPVVPVNDDGPSLIIKAMISVSTLTRSLFHPGYLESETHDICGIESILLNPNLEALRQQFEEMYESSESGEQVDPLKICTIHEILLLMPAHKARKAQLLALLGDVCSKNHQSREIDELNKAVSIYEDAVRENSEFIHWYDLGLSLHNRFEQKHDIADVNKSIHALENALRLIPDGNPNKALCNHILGASLVRSFEQQGNLSDLNRSVQAFQDAVLLTPNDHPDKPIYFNSLGSSLLHCFDQLHDLSDLDRSIQAFEDAVLLTPNNHPAKPSHSSDLGSSLLSRFEQLGSLSDLNRSTQMFEDVLLLIPSDHPAKHSHFSNLGNSLLSRFKQLGSLSDLTRSIQLFEDAVQLVPNDHPSKPSYLSNLGVSLLNYFNQSGDLSILNRSIQISEDTILLTPDGQPEKPDRLNNLGNSLMRHFEELGDLPSLSRSIKLFEDAILLAPDDDPHRAGYLNNLGTSLLPCFQHLGDLSDLNRSIQVFEEAVMLTPDGNPAKSDCLQNLGSSLLHRFNRLDDLADLNRAIKVSEDAVILLPNDHPGKSSCLNGLGNSLLQRFERQGNLVDLNRSIQVQEDAILLTANPNKPVGFSNLGNSLLSRFKALGNLSDLNRSIQVFEDAVQLTPNDHPRKPYHFTNLGNSLLTRFEKLGNLSDLNKSIEIKEYAIQLISNDHPDKPSHLNDLGNSFRSRFERLGNQHDLDAAILHYSSAAQSISGPSHARFIAAACWIQCIEHHPPSQSMQACAVMVDLIPQLTWLGSSIHDRHHQVTKAGELIRDAAATAIAAGEYETAVEWLEQGRSVIWSQLLQLRSPVDELIQVNPKFAARLESLSSQLERLTSSDDPNAHQSPVDYHSLAYERENLLQEIRNLSGFERFLLPKKLPQLLPAADRGPIVMLNVTSVRCDALILRPGHSNVLHVPLGITLRDAWAWRDLFQDALSKGIISLTEHVPQRLKGVRLPDPGMAVDREYVFAFILEELWNHVVQPVLSTLGMTEPTTDIHRIWWCPTGPLAFLPIHAAGVYLELSGPKLSDFAVSSYTPTLTALFYEHISQRSEKPQILTVALPSESRLPGTAKEVKCVASHAQDFPVLSLLESQATSQHVSVAMKESAWAHFACHGMQNISNPTESCLLLAGNSKLTLSDIIKLHLGNTELAFLSACETATGDKELEEEAVHLAAGMLLAGYRGVIATMWTIDDDIAVQVADETYRLLFKEYNADSTCAAEALQSAVKKVCKGAKAPLFSCLPFIHMGI